MSGEGDESGRRRVAIAVAIGGAVASVPFLSVLWGFGFRPFRTAVHQRIFSDFYDLQARALLSGDLHVPEGALSIEAFFNGGREYLYFPPFPALLRMPIFVVTDSLDGRLTAISMLAAWVVTIVVTGLLIWRVRGIVRPGVPVGRLELASWAALVAVIGGGSVLVFDASLPWVYHETYLWSTALTLGSLHAAIGVLERPSGRRIALAACWVTATILTRTTTGWACCATLLAVGAYLALRGPRDQRRLAVAAAAAGAGALLIGAAVNFAKFRHPYLFPLDAQRWTQLSAHRREALERNGGHLTGVGFFPTTFTAYLRPDGIRFTSVFPFVTLPARAPTAVGGAFFDQSYRTGSITAFMPLLCVLGIVGSVATFRRRAAAGVALLRIPVAGAALITGGVLFYGYMAHRYTSEFLPLLVLASVIGTVVLSTWSPTWSVPRRAVLVGVGGALAVFGVVANAAIGTASARVVYGGESLRSLVAAQARVGDLIGRPRGDAVRRLDLPDLAAPTDSIQVIGDCSAMYLGTGDRYEPLVPFEIASARFDIDIVAQADGGAATLATFHGARERRLILEHRDRRLYRFVLVTFGQRPVKGLWFRLVPGESMEMSITPDLDDGAYVLESPLRFKGYVATTDLRINERSRPSVLRIGVDADEAMAELGAEITATRAPPSALCRDLVSG